MRCCIAIYARSAGSARGGALTLATVHNNNRLPLKGRMSTLGGTYAAIGGACSASHCGALPSLPNRLAFSSSTCQPTPKADR